MPRVTKTCSEQNNVTRKENIPLSVEAVSMCINMFTKSSLNSESSKTRPRLVLHRDLMSKLYSKSFNVSRKTLSFRLLNSMTKVAMALTVWKGISVALGYSPEIPEWWMCQYVTCSGAFAAPRSSIHLPTITDVIAQCSKPPSPKISVFYLTII